MDWSVGEESGRYTVVLNDSDGALRLSSVQHDGMETDSPEISITRDDHHGRLRVEIAGTLRLAHVAKVGDSWWIHLDGRIHVVRAREPGNAGTEPSEGSLSAPMPGTVLEVHIKEGQRVRKGQTLVVLEAMKMEHRIQAPKAGEVTELHFSVGDRVDMGEILVQISD
tara:strand:+ start:169 stop:669 length:501 start_codon:yes stop_codon:yes gene_type:complete